MKVKRQILTWKSYHKWIGLALTIFLLLFCVSGIILNHREFFASYSISRSLLPGSYHIKNYNNGIIKGTIPYYNNKLLAYGNAGIWLTDKTLSSFYDFNNGLPEGADYRNIRNIVQSPEGDIWCAAQFGIYKLNKGKWSKIVLPKNSERIVDIAVNKKCGTIVAMTRSAVYTYEGNSFIRNELKTPVGYVNKMSLFKTIWHLHSGDLFGTTGKCIVDIIAVVIIFLSVSGICLFVLPYSIKQGIKNNLKAKASFFKWNFKWHDKIGYYFIILTIILVVSGTCLRPPLMIPFVMTSTRPVVGSVFDTDNVWHDKLRGIEWDATKNEWLVSTSDGFFHIDKDFKEEPQPIDKKNTPPVSPMGITVFRPLDNGEWLIGSFSGMYIWNPVNGTIIEYFSKTPYEATDKQRPVSSHLITGFSNDLDFGDIVFDYSEGISSLVEMPDILRGQPMSLWNFALELHVGRCYAPVLGPVSELFIFISGLLVTLVLISGFILHKRHNN